MTAQPIRSTQPLNGVTTNTSARRHLQEDAIARFRQTLTGAADPKATALPRPRIDSSAERLDSRNLPDFERPDPNISAPTDAEHRDQNSSTGATAATVGSLHYSLPIPETAAQPATTANTADVSRLIEQATSVMIERASRSDACRFIVSLDHAIVGGASAEFVRDGAFLHVRLLARNDAAYRSMWTHRAELQERLAASTGLLTRVEILEVYGDGRSA